jgi:capsular exopolysaccharide synthesis family protein
MNRVAEALNRLRPDAAALGDGAGRREDSIRFFAPGQPAVACPWTVGTDPACAPPSELAPTTSPERGAARPPRATLGRLVSTRLTSPVGPMASRLIVAPSVSRAVQEEYNRLAAALHEAQVERGLRVIVVTSALAEEGKTLTAVNVALALSGAYGRRVLLVDADLRRPAIHELFDVPLAPGLWESLAGGARLSTTEVGGGLSVLTAGTGVDHPMQVLTSNRMRALLDHARRTFDWVVVDTAPIGMLPDARLLVTMADGALLVARARRTAYDVVQRACETLGPDRVLGLVLNHVADADLPTSYESKYDAPHR